MADHAVTRRDEAAQRSSLWDGLADDPIMEPTEALQIKRGFFRTLLGVANDYLGTLILVNVLVVAQTFVGVFLGLLIAALFRASGGVFLILLVVFGGLFGAPAFGGLFAYARSAGDPDARTTLAVYRSGMREYARRSWVLLSFQLVTGLLLFTNFRFYSTVHLGVVGLPILVVVLLLSLLWAMAGFYAWPLLVRDQSWRALGRNALLIALAAPGSTIGLLLGLGVLSTLMIVSRVLALVFLCSAWVITENVALQRLVHIYRERQQALEAAERGTDE